MDALLDALESFFDELTAIAWARTRAWRNVVAAAYPDTRVRWRDVFGAYGAGIGANALLPGRAGDLLRMYAIKRRVEGATYPTLASTLLADTLFDAVIGSLLIGWALATGILPGSHSSSFCA